VGQGPRIATADQAGADLLIAFFIFVRVVETSGGSLDPVVSPDANATIAAPQKFRRPLKQGASPAIFYLCQGLIPSLPGCPVTFI
jgi:hypothetical protein